MACRSLQMDIQVSISFILLYFILGNSGLISTVTFVAMLLYNFVRLITLLMLSKEVMWKL